MIISILGGAGLMGAGIVRDLLSDRTIIDITKIRICDAARDRRRDVALRHSVSRSGRRIQPIGLSAVAARPGAMVGETMASAAVRRRETFRSR